MPNRPQDEAAVWRELDFVAQLLADGRPYLCGERFGAADLILAAMSAAVVVSPVYGVPCPSPSSCRRTPRSWSVAAASIRPGVTRWASSLDTGAETSSDRSTLA
jgi:glutathione S-transferase